MTQSDMKRLMFGVAILGAVVAGTVVVMRRRKTGTSVARKSRKVETRQRNLKLRAV